MADLLRVADTDLRLVVDIQQVKMMLAGTNDVTKVREFRARAAAVEEYLRSKGKDPSSDIEQLSRARQAKLLAEVRLGELLAMAPLQSNRYTPSDDKVSLLEIGVSHKESSRAQQVASVPEERRDQYFRECKAVNILPSQQGLLAVAAKVAKEKLTVELKAQPLPKPTGEFDVVVLDPPWQYDTDGTTGIGCKYPTMTLDAIRALPVQTCSKLDSTLFVWTTNTFLRDTFQLVEDWGFRYRQLITWVKVGCTVKGHPLLGQTEHCILASRGKPVFNVSDIAGTGCNTTAILAKRREHSRKPDEFYSMVEGLCPGTKLEFFARQPRDGWAVWGAETTKFDGGVK